MEEFKFEISGRSFSIDEKDYKSQFDNIIEKLTSIQWIENADEIQPHPMYPLGVEFFKELRTSILKKFKDSTNYASHKSIIETLLKIRSEAFGDTFGLLNNRNNTPTALSNYLNSEKISLAIELYATYFQTTLANIDLDTALIEVILYLKNGHLGYEKYDAISEGKLENYLKWIVRFNREIRQKHEIKNRILNIEAELDNFKKQKAEINVTKELGSAWTSKRNTHALILAILLILISLTICFGYELILEWMINGNSSFDNCCEKMGFVDLIYGGIIYWGIQYKIIVIFIWFAAISLLIQLAKSQWHLINDAAERITIINTYKIFSENNQLGEPGKYMDALLQSIYRSADDGLLKDVKNIYTSDLPGVGAKSGDEK